MSNALDAPSSLAYFWPELVLIGTVIAIFLLDAFLGRRPGREAPAFALSLLGLALAGGLAVAQWGTTQAVFSGMLVVDPFAVFFKVVIIAGTLASLLFLLRSRETVADAVGETYGFVLVSSLCAMLLVAASNLLMIYLALEGVSLISYVLAGYSRGNRRASEAGLKYVIYGGVASGVMLMGLSYLYGLTGTLDLSVLPHRLVALSQGTAAAGVGASALRLALMLSVVFVMAGVGYKIAAAPFHMWCPDVYEGAPTPITAYFSVVPKAAGIAVLVRVFYVGFVEASDGGYQALSAVPWVGLFGVVAAATMTIGNLGALWQANVKRLLAYSSIAHVGYVLMAFVVLGRNGLSAMLFYVAIYTIMNLGAFFCLIAVRNSTGLEDMEGVRGFGLREPVTAACFTVFLLSLTGLPPMAGFIAKYFVFASVLEAGGLWYDVLVVVGVLNSAISLFYYARVLRAMYLTEPVDRRPVRVPVLQLTTVLVFAAATLVLGFLSYGISSVKGTAERALVFSGQAQAGARVADAGPRPPR